MLGRMADAVGLANTVATWAFLIVATTLIAAFANEWMKHFGWTDKGVSDGKDVDGADPD